ncbi:MAG: lyase family protein [Boseongicola sp.]
MPATPLDSALYRSLFGDIEVGKLFTDSAEIRAMMLVEGALAKAQGQLGVIPETSAHAIHRASLELQIDPSSIVVETGQNGVPVPGLVAAFRAEMNAPEHAQYLHWGATSQDIIDTGLALRIRQALVVLDARLAALLDQLAAMAAANASTPMIARTWGQAAVPTSFGAIVASWGAPLLRHRERLAEVRKGIETVTLSGAAGTLAAMDKGAQVRAAIAQALDLSDPEASRHSTRDGQAMLAAWITGVSNGLGKFGEDLIFLTATGIGEMRIAGGGSSSTMPQKSNPVTPSVLVALARLNTSLNSAMQGAVIHASQRDGAAWFTEWLTLPQMILTCARGLATANEIAASMTPDIDAMMANIDATDGAVFAEALTFELARIIPRPEAQAAVKVLVSEATADGLTVEAAARKNHPEIDANRVFSAAQQLGTAPEEARAFSSACSASDGGS